MDQRLEDIKQKFQRFEKADAFAVDHGDPPSISQYLDTSDLRYLLEIASLKSEDQGKVGLIIKTSQLHSQIGFLVGVLQALFHQRYSDIQSALSKAEEAMLKEGYINEGDLGDRPGLNWGLGDSRKPNIT